MSQKTKMIDTASLGKHMLIGGGLAFILITLFLTPVMNDPKPEWGKLWMLQPLLIVPLAGAAGGFFYNMMGFMRNGGLIKKILSYIICTIVYIIGLWIGTVLGLNGTLWN